MSDSGYAGLFDDFAGRRSPTQEDYHRALAEGLVLVDTNVLLNLYRSAVEPREELLNVLEQLGDRLWLPHQVIAEFWRHREEAVLDLQDAAETARKALSKLLDQSLAALHTWTNRVALPDDQVATLDEALANGFQQIEVAISHATRQTQEQQSNNTHDDRVLARLEPILRGRVGRPLDTSAQAAAISEGMRRVAAKEPPGYEDADKPGTDAAGDYIIWEQTLLEAAERKVTVLLVTEDLKQDWWHFVRGQRRGPRVELVEEMRDRAGVQLLVTRTEQLLRLAPEILHVSVHDSTVEDFIRVGASDGDVDEPGPDLPGTDAAGQDDGADRQGSTEHTDGGWTKQGVELLLRRLAATNPTQGAALRAALDSDGFVSREEVYRLGDYLESRTLRGFTRPVTRATRRLRDEGVIGLDAPDALVAVYNPDISYVQAAGFEVPESLLRVLP